MGVSTDCLYYIMSSPQGEQQREMEGLLDSVRQLTRELRREILVVDSFIPVEYQVRLSDSWPAVKL